MISDMLFLQIFISLAVPVKTSEFSFLFSGNRIGRREAIYRSTITRGYVRHSTSAKSQRQYFQNKQHGDRKSSWHLVQTILSEKLVGAPKTAEEQSFRDIWSVFSILVWKTYFSVQSVKKDEQKLNSSDLEYLGYQETRYLIQLDGRGFSETHFETQYEFYGVNQSFGSL